MLAGLVGSAGGITSLISYPALLAVGLPALSANVTNVVALLACWPGSAIGSRTELSGWGEWLRHWAPVAALGGATGAVLLLSTPSHLFSRIVPYLVLCGSLALLVEPWVAARRGHRTSRLIAPWLLLLAIYNGYFGAGAGVMILTLMLVTSSRELPIANALKNMLVGCAQVPAALLLAVLGPVRWTAALPLAVGMLVGSALGPGVARRVDPRIMRAAIVLFGVALAIDLWL